MSATPPGAVRAGTPDEPVVGPAPTGKPATRLDAIDVVSAQGGAVVKISGDGEFPYATFALGDPDRFVVDLAGVMNHSPRSTVSVNAGPVSRVRVAQFKPLPSPVARVVFDLQHGAVPRIERTAHSLVVSFGQAAAAAEGMAGEAKAPAHAAAPAEAVRPSTPEAPPVVAEVAPAPPPPAAKTTKQTSKAKSSRKSSRKADGIETLDASQASSSLTSTTTSTTKASLTPAKPSGSVTLAPAGQAPSDLQLKPVAGAPVGGAGGPAAGGPAIPSFASQTMGQAAIEKKYVGDPIDLKVTNADVTEVLRSFAQISGLNVIVQPGVSGVVTAEMENVPWDQALEEVLKINKLGFELDGNVMRIAPTTVLREEAQERQELAAAQSLAIPLKTVMQRLSYADAVSVASLLKAGQAGLLSQRGTVIVDTRTNTLIIKELPNFLDTVIAVIEQLDTPEPQVMIEARIIETTKHFNRDLGIRWSFEGISDAAHGNTTGLVFPNNADLKGNVEVGVAHNDILNLKLGNVLNTFTLDAALQAAENEGLIHILSAPKVATLNNHPAEIQSGLQIPIQTIANNTVTVQFVNATLRLAVTPQVTAEGTILMDIDISKREPQLAFLVPGATNAPIATKDARTKLVVRDGGTAVIGGIYKVTSNESQDRIPGLANIPILGNLFKNKSKSEDNEELLIFITPRVIKL
ncbi:MAG TPA: type IV pilus secretin PilQ [Thermoanaerobaculia bacterium]|nr:type IV pilus secretin PilQ [Thermoanaerobaculia bacterium]